MQSLLHWGTSPNYYTYSHWPTRFSFDDSQRNVSELCAVKKSKSIFDRSSIAIAACLQATSWRRRWRARCPRCRSACCGCSLTACRWPPTTACCCDAWRSTSVPSTWCSPVCPSSVTTRHASPSPASTTRYTGPRGRGRGGRRGVGGPSTWCWPVCPSWVATRHHPRRGEGGGKGCEGERGSIYFFIVDFFFPDALFDV